MFSKTAEYALRAVAVIAETANGKPVFAKDIARQAEIPPKYLSKVLRDLVHVGVLRSARGIGGGFKLNGPAGELKLIDVIRPFDDVGACRRCPLGNARCQPQDPCPMHDYWKPVQDAFETLMERTTVEQIVYPKNHYQGR